MGQPSRAMQAPDTLTRGNLKPAAESESLLWLLARGEVSVSPSSLDSRYLVSASWCDEAGPCRDNPDTEPGEI